MKLSVKSLTQKISFLLLLTLINLISIDTFAAQFRIKSEKGKSSIRTWSDPLNWQVYNTTQNAWVDATTLPTATDEVLVDDANQIEILVPMVEIGKLTVHAPTNNSDELTRLNIKASNLKVYGNVLVTNGQFNGNARVAEIVVEGQGILEASGSITPTTSTAYNKITVNTGGIVRSNQNITPLPVELTSFNAVKKNNEVNLTWETASEKNNYGFEIQAATDGKNYEAIGFVNSQNGNASVAQRYAYTHKVSNREGLIYYRLKQVDLDGTASYYHTKAVNLGSFNYQVATYPNPFQNAFKLNLETATTQTADVFIMDMTGKIVYHAQHAVTKGANTLEITLQDQPAGLYLLKAVTGDQSYTNRLVKH